MPTVRSICEVVIGTFFTFKTPRLVRVRSYKIGLIFRSVQLLIFAYIFGYAILYKKGYQETDKPESSVTAKVKGIASTIDRHDLPKSYRRVWDTPDYVVPPQDNGAFFVMTNAIITPRQRFDECPEDPAVSPCPKLSENDTVHCPKGQVQVVGSGILTGRCVLGRNLETACEVAGWCPVEYDALTSTRALLPQVANFTVFIKNNIEFKKFQVKRSNIPDQATSSYLRRCRYHHKTDPTCPIFSLGYMTDAARTDFNQIAFLGGVISIGIQWDCDFDHDESECIPKYKFGRLDDDSSKVSPGWNFRYANYYRMANGDSARDLIKAYGILFIFTVNGKGGKFSFVPLFVNIGAGVALLGVATLACDIILLYIDRNRDRYQETKFLEVRDKDLKRPFARASVPSSANNVNPPSMESTGVYEFRFKPGFRHTISMRQWNRSPSASYASLVEDYGAEECKNVDPDLPRTAIRIVQGIASWLSFVNPSQHSAIFYYDPQPDEAKKPKMDGVVRKK